MFNKKGKVKDNLKIIVVKKKGIFSVIFNFFKDIFAKPKYIKIDMRGYEPLKLVEDKKLGKEEKNNVTEKKENSKNIVLDNDDKKLDDKKSIIFQMKDDNIISIKKEFESGNIKLNELTKEEYEILKTEYLKENEKIKNDILNAKNILNNTKRQVDEYRRRFDEIRNQKKEAV